MGGPPGRTRPLRRRSQIGGCLPVSASTWAMSLSLRLLACEARTSSAGLVGADFVAFHQDAFGLPDDVPAGQHQVRVVLVLRADQGHCGVAGEQQPDVLVAVAESVGPPARTGSTHPSSLSVRTAGTTASTGHPDQRRVRDFGCVRSARWSWLRCRSSSGSAPLGGVRAFETAREVLVVGA